MKDKILFFKRKRKKRKRKKIKEKKLISRKNGSCKILWIPHWVIRGAHFEKNFIQFGWVIDISNNFSWGFQKCQFYHCRSHPVDAPSLPTQPTYRLGHRLRGQNWCVEGVCLIKKSQNVPKNGRSKVAFKFGYQTQANVSNW